MMLRDMGMGNPSGTSSSHHTHKFASTYRPDSALAYVAPGFRRGRLQSTVRLASWEGNAAMFAVRQVPRTVTHVCGRVCKGLGTAQRTTRHKGFCRPEA